MFEFSEIELKVRVTLRIIASGCVRVYNVWDLGGAMIICTECPI